MPKEHYAQLQDAGRRSRDGDTDRLDRYPLSHAVNIAERTVFAELALGTR